MTLERAHALLRDMSLDVAGELITFGRALEAAGHGPAVDGWPYFLERSEKWAGEYAAWVNAGKPDDPELVTQLLDHDEQVTP